MHKNKKKNNKAKLQKKRKINVRPQLYVNRQRTFHNFDLIRNELLSIFNIGLKLDIKKIQFSNPSHFFIIYLIFSRHLQKRK